jgi:quercetin dioxygenase-like cupin family protein
MCPVIRSTETRKADLPELAVEALATPGLGAAEHVVMWSKAKTGYHVLPHTHDHEEVVVVLGGSATASLDSNETTVGKGDVVVIPAGTVSEFVALDDDYETITIKPAGTRYFDPAGGEIEPPAITA